MQTHTTSSAGVKDWTTNTLDCHKRKTLPKHLPSPFSLVLTWQAVVPSRSYPHSQETQGEARAHLKQWGRGSSQPAAPATQAESLLHTTCPHTPSLLQRQHQCQKHQGLVDTSGRLRDFYSGCVPQPRDMLASPDPTPHAGFEVRWMPIAALDQSVPGH